MKNKRPVGFHPRNKHAGRYNFEKLVEGTPEFAAHVVPNAYGELSLDFTNPQAVKTLNQALLKLFYGLNFWQIPPSFLCPPIPGRADYVHSIADLLACSNHGVIPQGHQVKALDIGVGASCIYPIIGNQEYGWRFLGTDIHTVALDSARLIVKSNPTLVGAIDFYKQDRATKIFEGAIVGANEFDFTICNPPFHESLADAQEGSRRKWQNLGREEQKQNAHFNFGGTGAELWCQGGEAAFIERMIEESKLHRMQVLWFTTLVSKQSSLKAIYKSLKNAGVATMHTVEMSQGQKTSRFVAWTYLNETQRQSWSLRRWG